MQTGQFNKSGYIFSERLRNPESQTKWWKRALLKTDWHYIQTETKKGIEKRELYNIHTDYRERKDLSNSECKLTETMAYRVSQEPLPTYEDNEDNVEIELDRELYNQLRSLGYLN